MVRSRALYFYISLFSSLYTFSGFALSLDELLINSKKHYPVLKNLILNKKLIDQKVNEAVGSFDTQFDAMTSQRATGFYDGDDISLKVTKPLRFLNSKVYTSYRKSEGKFPTYNNDQRTLNEGEFKAGVSFSLWRNRDIDSKRLKLKNTILDQDRVEAENLVTEQVIVTQISESYWNWVAAGKIYEVHKELLDFAIARNDNLKKRIKAGDLSEIYEVENLQYIVKRRGKLFESLKKYLKSSLMLSLFYRSKDGLPRQLVDSDLPVTPKFERTKINLVEDLKRVRKNHPKLRALEFYRKQLDNEEALKENNLAPSLDFDLSLAQDFGDVEDKFDETIEQREFKALVKMNIPLERNLVRSQLSQVRIKKKILKQKNRLVTDQIQAKASALFYEIVNLENIIEQAYLEISYAKRLVKAEIQKFDKGTSDFFVINLREQNLADAKIRKWGKLQELNARLAEYEALTTIVSAEK